MSHRDRVELSGLQGLWRRSLIRRPDGTQDTQTRVCWLQGIRAFLDLRQPATLGVMAHCRALAALSLDDCLRLAEQQGFEGELTFDGEYFQWVRGIDFQPKSMLPDAGSLCWEAGILVERGRDIAYTEHWHRDDCTAQPVGSLALRADSGVGGRLLRVGPWFMYARDRAAALPPGTSLQECVSAAPTLAQAQAFVDCEISLGTVTPDGFLITASTLPYRVGDILDVQAGHETLTLMDRDAFGNSTTRSWSITAREGHSDALKIWASKPTI